jgi:hypothetical protein
VYADSVTNSILLLLHVGLPVAARLGVGLGPKPAPEAALALPPIRCTAEEVLSRFQGLFGALSHLLVHPAAAKPGTALSVDVSAVLRVVANVRKTGGGSVYVCACGV